MTMPKIDSELINQIRNKVDIVDVISSCNIKLETRGKNYFGVCPFHEDHSPSMSVSREKQIYTCFSCGATGNVFKFLQDFENISFIEAVKKCADISGLELNINLTPNDRLIKKNKSLYDIYSLSQKFYQNNINSTLGKNAKEYLYNRQLTDNEIKKFEIGLSLDEYDMLAKLLVKKGFSDKDLIKSGIVNANDNGLYDVYRDRIMFPLQDINGNVIGYNGRAYKGNIVNRYVNSKETEIFKKRDYIYNFHRARESAKEKNEIIIMEGPMDVIRASTIGIDNVVATLGTSFSSSQANLIKRLSNNVILCFDGDDAGLKGTKSAILELQKIDINPKIVRLPDDLDPDEYIKKYGKDKFVNVLNNAYNILEFKEILLKSEINLNKAEDMSKYIKIMIDEINSIDDDILKEITINKLVEETKVSKDTIISKLKPKEKVVTYTSFNINKKNTDKYTKSIEALLYYMLYDESVINEYDKRITHIADDNYRHLGFQISAFYKKNGYIDVADLLTDVNADTEIEKTIGKIMSLELSDNFTMEQIDDYLNNIKEYNDLKVMNKYKNDMLNSSTMEEKMALAQKLIDHKLRSEENDR